MVGPVSRPREYTERTTVHVRLPVELADRLKAAAGERQVSVNRIAEWAITEWLDRMDELEAFEGWVRG